MWNESLFCELAAQIAERNSMPEQWWIIEVLRFFESEKGKQCSESQREILKMSISEAIRRERKIFKQLSRNLDENDVKGSLDYPLTSETKRAIVSIIDDVAFLYRLRNAHVPDREKQLSLLADKESDHPEYMLSIHYNRRANRDFYIERLLIQKMLKEASEENR